MKSPSLLQVSAALLALSNNHMLVSADDDSDFVTCGSAIKLTHREKSGKNYYLSSGPHRINAGSGQQLVTSSPNKGEASTLWIIKEGHNADPCEPGSKIPFGTKIRLTHAGTGLNLHSHHAKSPLSSQQEVTAYGGDGEGDHGDDWIVNPAQGSSNYWKKDNEVFITHDGTRQHLGSSEQAQFGLNNCGRQCPVMDHLEVFGRKEKDSFVKWKTSMGVFLHK
mmetsp:Transcript_5097/g.7774  ORF Transcript_5097/g.7774 Transcript_5097/m.7774 type:complete len:222 (-) Transcript_5097:166-831(-)